MIYDGIGELREDLLLLTQNLVVIQSGLRVELIEIQPFEMALQETIRLGLVNRLDLMNERAEVMDFRREVEIRAQLLKSSLEIRASGELLDIDDPHSITLDFETPLDQIDERNNYRTALVNYQRAKRRYIQAEDQVKQQIREAWRRLYVLKRNLETSRRAVRIAALQYDSAVNEANKPAQAGQIGRTSSGGLQGQNLQRALEAILRATNNLISDWTEYERNRINIYRDMGIMEIGPDGIWIDEFYLEQTYEDELEPNRNGEDLDHSGSDLGGDGSSLGGGAAESEVDRIDPGVELIGGGAVGVDHGHGDTWSVFDHSLSSGESGQPEQRDAQEPSGRVNDDHLSGSGGDMGRRGGRAVRTGFFTTP